MSLHGRLAAINNKSRTLGKRYLRNTDNDWYHLYFWVHDENEKLCAVVGVCAIPSLREVVSEEYFNEHFKSQEQLNALPKNSVGPA